MGDEETNASLGDSVWDRDGAYVDGEVDRTGSSGGEGTNGPGGINGVIVGDEETNGSLGDGMQERNGYQQSRRVRAGIEVGCASALEEVWTRAWPRFLEEDLECFMGTAFMGTDGEVEVGNLRGSVRQRLSCNARGE